MRKYAGFLYRLSITGVLFVVPTIASAAIMSVSPSSGSAAVGSTFTIQIQVNTQGGAADGVDVRYVNFNPSLLQVIDENTLISGVQVSPGTLMANTPTNSVDNIAGRISFSQVPAGGTTFTNNSAQTLATVRFNVIAAGAAALTFNFTSGSTADCNIATGGSDLLTSVTNGTYTLTTANVPPTVSAISTNVADVDSGTPGIQYYEGTTVTYSGSASDANGDPLTWTWLYTINGGVEIQFSTGSGAVQNAVFTYGAGTAGSTYRWILRVTDRITSPVQSSIDVMIIAVPDTTAPIITNVAASNITTSGAVITWITDELSDTQVEYGITTSYGSLSPLNTTRVTSHSVTLSSLSPSTTYNYRVHSRDAAGNLASSLNRTFITQSLPDTTPPASITNVAASGITTTSATLTWSAPADLPGGGTVASYDIRRSTTPITELNFASATTVTGEPAPAAPGTNQTYIIAGLNSSTLYYAVIKSQDAQGNISLISNIASFTTQTPADTTPPSVPANLVAIAASVSQINLSWSASTDNIGVAGYRVERCAGSGCTTFAQVASPSVTNYSDTGLVANTTYRYQVRAVDAAGNLSGYSSIANATTQDTIAPTISITSPTANAIVAGTISVSANATDNVGIMGVQFIVDGGNVGAEDATAPYSVLWNTTSVADGSHIITARARDAAGNTTVSNGVTVNVLNNPPPPFDYSLANEGNKFVVQSSSVINTITASLVSGTAKAVIFSISGLPTGATGAFVPPSCSPGCSSVLTITTISTTPVGTSAITVSATDGSIVRTTNFSLTVNLPPSTKFKQNDRVAVRSADGNGVGVYNGAGTSNTLLINQPDGTLGAIVGGPVFANNAHWWQVNYDTSGGIGTDTDGWSTEDELTLAVFASNLKFIPSTEGNEIFTRDFVVSIVQRTSSTTLFSFTVKPNTAGEIPVSILVPTLLEGTYNVLIKASAYLRSFVKNAVFNSDTSINLPKLRGGDMNDDGVINSFDWSFMNDRWFGADLTADLNRDGVVNSIDFSFMNKNWGLTQD